MANAAKLPNNRVTRAPQVAERSFVRSAHRRQSPNRPMWQTSHGTSASLTQRAINTPERIDLADRAAGEHLVHTGTVARSVVPRPTVDST